MDAATELVEVAVEDELEEVEGRAAEANRAPQTTELEEALTTLLLR